MTIGWRQLGRGEVDHELLWSLVGLVALPLGAFLAAHAAAFPIGCAFKAVTGLPCPTCGSTRAMDALVRGEVGAALRLNPLATIGALAWAAWVPYGILASRADRRLRAVLSPREQVLARWGAIGLLTVIWLLLVVDGR